MGLPSPRLSYKIPTLLMIGSHCYTLKQMRSCSLLEVAIEICEIRIQEETVDGRQIYMYLHIDEAYSRISIGLIYIVDEFLKSCI